MKSIEYFQKIIKLTNLMKSISFWNLYWLVKNNEKLEKEIFRGILCFFFFLFLLLIFIFKLLNVGETEQCCPLGLPGFRVIIELVIFILPKNSVNWMRNGNSASNLIFLLGRYSRGRHLENCTYILRWTFLILIFVGYELFSFFVRKSQDWGRLWK